MFAGYAAHHADNSDAAAWYLTGSAAAAWVAGRFDDAQHDLDRLGHAFTPSVAQRFGVDRHRLRGETRLVRSDHADAYLAARALADAGERVAAVEAFDAPYEAFDDDYARVWLMTESVRLSHDSHFDALEPFDLILGNSLAGWRLDAGEWHVDDENRLVGVGNSDGLLLRYVGDVGQSDAAYELTGTIEVIPPDGDRFDPGAGFVVNQSTNRFNQILLLPQTRQRITVALHVQVPPVDLPEYRDGPNDFTIRVARGQVTFRFNDGDFSTPWQVLRADHSRATATYVIALGGVNDSRADGVTVRYADLKLRPLPRE